LTHYETIPIKHIRTEAKGYLILDVDVELEVSKKAVLSSQTRI